eukprot:10023443-Alexandrium_andersonii.AAC.1
MGPAVCAGVAECLARVAPRTVMRGHCANHARCTARFFRPSALLAKRRVAPFLRCNATAPP